MNYIRLLKNGDDELCGVAETASDRIWANVVRSRSRRCPPRVFLYSHDTYGLGHLRRNLAIAEHLMRRKPGFSVRLLTGSPVIDSWVVPEGLDVTALPPVVKTGVETYAPRNSSLPFGLVKAYRESLILKSVIVESPDIFLVDHAPAGMNAELLSTLAFIRREMPQTQVILGLRDILDSPEKVRAIWEQQSIIPLLENLYHRILVYGSRELFDVVESYGIPEHVAEKLTYCGYVGRAPGCVPPTRDNEAPTVLVTAGGGEDGHFLMEAYLKALPTLSIPGLRSCIVTGPLMSKAQRAALEGLAGEDANIEIIASTTNLPAILQQADLVIAMGGYNTSVEIVASEKPAILVPRAAPRAEQRLRAKLLAQLGLVLVVEPGPELEARLASSIEAALTGVKPCTRRAALDIDGVSRVGDLLDAIIQKGTEELEAVN